MRLIRNKFRGKLYLIIWLILLIGYTFYVEFISYISNNNKWLKPECDMRSECTKILLVADPQIIGKYQEKLKHLTPLSIFDSDLYLKRTYQYAFKHVEPDVVILLGDLMDEGAKADNKEFNEYVRRIFNIFLEQSSMHTRYIWIPGDNDVGGENGEGAPKFKMDRFERAFRQPDLILHRNITYMKINRLTQTIPIFKEKREFYDTSKIFVGLSHYPMIFMPSLFVDKVLTKLLPHVIFTGHEHKSMIVSTDALLRQDRQIIPVTPDNNDIFEYTLGMTDMYEIIVPTCSYRMGTDKIGYGFAIIERNRLRYTVLWSPSRFHQLKNYLILIVTFILSTICYSFLIIGRKILRHFTSK